MKKKIDRNEKNTDKSESMMNKLLTAIYSFIVAALGWEEDRKNNDRVPVITVTKEEKDKVHFFKIFVRQDAQLDRKQLDEKAISLFDRAAGAIKSKAGKKPEMFDMVAKIIKQWGKMKQVDCFGAKHVTVCRKTWTITVQVEKHWHRLPHTMKDMMKLEKMLNQRKWNTPKKQQIQSHFNICLKLAALAGELPIKIQGKTPVVAVVHVPNGRHAHWEKRLLWNVYYNAKTKKLEYVKAREELRAVKFSKGKKILVKPLDINKALKAHDNGNGFKLEGEEEVFRIKPRVISNKEFRARKKGQGWLWDEASEGLEAAKLAGVELVKDCKFVKELQESVTDSVKNHRFTLAGLLMSMTNIYNCMDSILQGGATKKMVSNIQDVSLKGLLNNSQREIEKLSERNAELLQKITAALGIDKYTPPAVVTTADREFNPMSNESHQAYILSHPAVAAWQDRETAEYNMRQRLEVVPHTVYNQWAAKSGIAYFVMASGDSEEFIEFASVACPTDKQLGQTASQ